MHRNSDFCKVIDDLFSYWQENKSASGTPSAGGASESGSSYTQSCSKDGWTSIKALSPSKISKFDGVYLLKWNCNMYVPSFYNTLLINPKAINVSSTFLNKLCYLRLNNCESTILYIGKAENLSRRLYQFYRSAKSLAYTLNFGAEFGGSHKGGKLIWSLQDKAGNVAWDTVYFLALETTLLISWINTFLAKKVPLILPINSNYLKCVPRLTCSDFERLFIQLCSVSEGYNNQVLPIANGRI